MLMDSLLSRLSFCVLAPSWWRGEIGFANVPPAKESLHSSFTYGRLSRFALVAYFSQTLLNRVIFLNQVSVYWYLRDTDKLFLISFDSRMVNIYLLVLDHHLIRKTQVEGLDRAVEGTHTILQLRFKYREEDIYYISMPAKSQSKQSDRRGGT